MHQDKINYEIFVLFLNYLIHKNITFEIFIQKVLC